MKITIENIEIKNEQVETIIRIKQDLQNYEYNNRNLSESVSRLLVSSLAEKLILERGPEIINSITNNQIINAVIMKVAGSLGGERN